MTPEYLALGLAALAALVNVLWTVAKLRAEARVIGHVDELRKEMVCQRECDARHQTCDDRHAETCRRLEHLEAA